MQTDLKRIKKSMMREADMVVQNDNGDFVFLKHYFDSEKKVAGVIDCCFADDPCEWHRKILNAGKGFPYRYGITKFSPKSRKYCSQEQLKLDRLTGFVFQWRMVDYDLRSKRRDTELYNSTKSLQRAPRPELTVYSAGLDSAQIRRERLAFRGMKSMNTKRSLQERIADADARANAWLAKINECLERGEHFKAADISSKLQFWLDRSNNLRGCGPLPVPEYLTESSPATTTETLLADSQRKGDLK